MMRRWSLVNLFNVQGMKKLRLLQFEHNIRDFFRSHKKVSPANYLISELQRDFKFFQIGLDSLEREIGSSWLRDIQIEANQIYSRFDDALKVMSPPSNDSDMFQICDFQNLINDFSENYAARFGLQYSSKIRIYVNPNLPILQAPVSPLSNFIDTLVRAVKGMTLSSEVDFYIDNVKEVNSVAGQAQVKILVIGRRLALENNFIKRRLRELKSGNLGHFVSDLGPELCSAVLQARNLKAEYKIYNKNRRGYYEFILTLPVHAEQSLNLKAPAVFYLHSRDEDTCQAFEGFTKYCGCKLQVVDQVSAVPNGQRLIYDASTYDNKEVLQLAAQNLPKNTIIILPADSWALRNDLSRAGFQYFTAAPFIGFHFLEGGLEAFEANFDNKPLNSSSYTRSVLIVDDAPTARMLLKNYFILCGDKVSEASNGLEMLSLISNGNKYDAIFCDLNMPELDGPEAVERLRLYEREHDLPKTPVALMTAYASNAEELLKTMPNFDECLIKPVNLQAAGNFLASIKPDSKSYAIQQHVNDIKLKENLFSVLNGKPKVPKNNNEETRIILLDELKSRCSGKNDLVFAVIEAFLSASKSQLEELSKLKLEGDKPKLLRCLHAIKGLLKDVAANSAADSVQALEEKYTKSESDLQSMMSDFETVEKVCYSAQRAAQRALKELRASM